jgi:hypothetical protein
LEATVRPLGLLRHGTIIFREAFYPELKSSARAERGPVNPRPIRASTLKRQRGQGRGRTPRVSVRKIRSALGVANASAQEKHRFTFKNPAQTTEYTQQYVLDVKDIPGHQVRIVEVHRTPQPEDAGRYAWHRIFWQNSGVTRTFLTPDGTKKTYVSGTGVITGGTGKMRGIRGTRQGTARLEFRDGKAVSNEVEGEVEYGFE